MAELDKMSGLEPVSAEDRTPSKCMFFQKLPKEIRDLIYGFAYGKEKQSPFHLIPLKKWADNERMRRKLAIRRSQAFTPKTIGPCPLLGMMVSKQFCEEAVSQWFHITTVQCSSAYEFNEVINSSRAVSAYLAHYRGSWSTSNPLGIDIFSDFNRLKRCKNLRSLHLTVQENVFKVFESRLACVDEYSDKDFDDVQEVHDLLSMRLSSVTLLAGQSTLAAAPPEEQKWQANVAALEAYINRRLKEQEAERKEKAEAGEDFVDGLVGRTSNVESKLMWIGDARSNDDFGECIGFLARRGQSSKRPLEHAENALVDEEGLHPKKLKKVEMSFRGAGAGGEASHQDCRSLVGFTRQHPAAAAVMGSAFALSVINSVVLMRQML